MINLKYQIDRILYQVFKIILNILKKTWRRYWWTISRNIIENKIENRITFKIKNGSSLELLTSETIKLLGGTENKITKDKSSENVPHLEITEVVLVHCNIVNNDYQQDWRVLYTFILNKPFGSLLVISPTNYIFLKTFNSEYGETIIWFTDQNSQPWEMEDRMDLTMVVKWRIKKWDIQLNHEICKRIWIFVLC